MNLLEHLESIKDPRDSRGVRHPMAAVMKALVLGLLAGMSNIDQIAEYIAQQWDELKDELGFEKWYAPDGDTYRRVLNKLDSKVLSDVFTEWMSEFLKDKEFDAAIDGKACRGVVVEGKPSGKGVQLLNVFAHDLQVVLAGWPLENKKGESTVARQHLKALIDKYPGLRLLTGDAAFSGRNLCEAINTLHKDYLVRIKGNQPDVEGALSFWFEEHLKRRPKPDAKTVEKKSPDYYARTVSVSS
ncbi:MAG: ISAs1 family transposase [Thermodesulfobacteriota bacterium]